VSGLTDFSDTMGSAVAVFNGAFLQAFVGIAPDHTATQLNRLSDTAFSSNSVVDKLHAKVFAIFIPASFFLDKHEQNRFWKNTNTAPARWLPERINNSSNRRPEFSIA